MDWKEQYTNLINKEMIRPDSYVKAIQELDGIYVDFYYIPEGESELCYCCRYDDEKKPNEQVWKEAQDIAVVLGEQFNVEVIIENDMENNKVDGN